MTAIEIRNQREAAEAPKERNKNCPRKDAASNRIRTGDLSPDSQRLALLDGRRFPDAVSPRLFCGIQARVSRFYQFLASAAMIRTGCHPSADRDRSRHSGKLPAIDHS